MALFEAHDLHLRFGDRVGKALRNPPRDSSISTPTS